jgi:hypothetical protein
MTSKQKDSLFLARTKSAGQHGKSTVKPWMRMMAQIFAGQPIAESVATSIVLHASPQIVWDRMLSYEEVPKRPPLILRALLPVPLRTEGDKTRVGEDVQCLYGEGDLVKQITAVQPPHLLEFDVNEQHLGIEGCVLAIGGSYRIEPSGSDTEIILTTNYYAYLQPRFIWCPLEAFLAHRFHRHILEGMRDSIPKLESSEYRMSRNHSVPKGLPPQGPPCTTSE